MSETAERIYTINLGKVILSPNNIRARRAINMIREFARRHMKNENILIEEDVAHHVWKRGIKHPPRKIRVGMDLNDEGNVRVYLYDAKDARGDAARREEPVSEEPVSEPDDQELESDLPELEDNTPKAPAEPETTPGTAPEAGTVQEPAKKPEM